MKIEIKTFSTWCNEHFVLYMNGNYAGSFDTYKEAKDHGEKLKKIILHHLLYFIPPQTFHDTLGWGSARWASMVPLVPDLFL